MEDRTPLLDYDRTEKLIRRMERDGYIVKVKENSGTGGDDDVYWVVGPRGKVEVGENGVRGLAKTVFGTMASEAEEDELERKIARSLGLSDKSDFNRVAPPAEPGRRNRRAGNDAEERAGNRHARDDAGEGDDDDDGEESD
jgi:DNA-binding PadR family transcriptional regulator